MPAKPPDAAGPEGPGAIVPGVLVRHPGCPDWGLGQVQSVVGERITVNFENAGKRVVIASRITLVVADAASE